MAFNSDHLIWVEFKNLINKYDVDVIVETGTYKAQSTIDFAGLGLPVHTTESNVTYYNEAIASITEHAHNNPDHSDTGSITTHLGDSPKILEAIIPPMNIDEKRIIFFLDAHWYVDNCLERELSILANIAFALPPIILIHDIYVPDHPEYNFDVYNGRPISWEWIYWYADKIYGEDNHTHWYNTGISDKATHNRGCIFIAPHLTK